MNHFAIVVTQQGPFLHVVNLDEECLPLRPEPSSEAEELDCVADRVLLRDLGQLVETEGVTWHKAKMSACPTVRRQFTVKNSLQGVALS